MSRIGNIPSAGTYYQTEQPPAEDGAIWFERGTAPGGTQIWTYGNGDGRGCGFNGTTVVYGNQTDEVEAIDFSSQEVKWSKSYADHSRAIELTEETAFVGTDSDEGRLIAIDLETGNELWSVSESYDISQLSYSVADDAIFYRVADSSGSANNEAVAVSASNGSEMWRFAPNTNYPEGPAISDGLAVISFGDELFGLDAADGSQLWNVTKSYPSSSTAIDSDKIYISLYGDVQAIDRETRNVAWDQYISPESISLSDGVLAVATDDGVTGVDATDGSERWSYPTDYGPYRTAIKGDVVIATANMESGTVHAINSKDTEFYTDSYVSDGSGWFKRRDI